MIPLPKGSHTFLSDYQICPSRAFHKHVARDAPFESTAAIEQGNTAHNAMEKRIVSGVPLPPTISNYEVFCKPFDGRKSYGETRLGIRRDGTTCSFYADDCWFGGKLDAYILNEAETAAAMFDWKTGKVREDDTELRRQAVLLKAAVPSLVNIVGRYVWLGPMKLGSAHDLSDTERTMAEMISIMSTIGNYAEVNHWPTREGPLCGYCPVKDCRFNRTK